jgi:aminomethyltransferase
VYRLTDSDAYGVVCNASNRERVVAHFERNKGGRDARMADSTLDTAMIAVQGPKALATAQQVFDGPLAGLKYYHHVSGEALGTPASASRTGYTGEDGFELVVHRDLAEALWTRLLEYGHPYGCQPCGLGARDTLRLEAAMPLYGHELGEEIDPYSVGLGMFIKLDKGDFIGREALREKKAAPPKARIGLALRGKRIAREGAAVVVEGRAVGAVTSGTFSPTLQKPLAMAMVSAPAPAAGGTVGVDIRGQVEEADVVQLPFYKRAK